VPISDDTVQVQPGAGKAELHIDNLPIEDYFNLPNALRDGHEVDATVSFTVVWSGPVTRRVSVTDGTNGDQFAGEFAENHVTVTWSGSNELGFSFHSNPGNLSTSVPGRGFAEVGHVRNGLFFGEGGDGGGSSPARASVSTDVGRDQAFAALALVGENWSLQTSALAPGATDLVPRDSWNDAPGGPTAGATGEGAFTFAPDPTATSLVTDAGLPAEDVLFH
jgi:hypothetical protein